MRKGMFFLGSTLLFVLLPMQTVEARKVLPMWNVPSAGAPISTGGKPASSVTFIPGRLGVNVKIGNPGSASSVNYSLTYFSKGVEQGVDGAIKLSGTTVTKQLIFGSCSTNNNCRYDSDITDAKLTVTTVLKNGKKIIKPFKLKV